MFLLSTTLTQIGGRASDIPLAKGRPSPSSSTATCRNRTLGGGRFLPPTDSTFGEISLSNRNRTGAVPVALLEAWRRPSPGACRVLLSSRGDALRLQRSSPVTHLQSRYISGWLRSSVIPLLGGLRETPLGFHCISADLQSLNCRARCAKYQPWAPTSH